MRSRKAVGGLLFFALVQLQYVSGDLLVQNACHSRLRSRVEVPTVAVWNTVGYHNEVVAALLYSSQQAGARPTAYVQLASTWNMEQVISGWYSQPFKDSRSFLADACRVGVVIFATYPEHHCSHLAELLNMHCAKQSIILTVHNPSQLESPGHLDSLSLMNRTGVHVLALAPHAVAATQALLRKHGIPNKVELFVPVFPVDTSCQGDNIGCLELPGESRAGFVLQGLYAKSRRNYDGLFEMLRSNTELVNHPDFRVSLLGQGDLALPSALAAVVQKRSSLDYREYYGMIEGSLAVLTAFASEIYVKDKASSSIATALICGTPLIMTREALAAYSFLIEDAVFISEGNDAEAMLHAMSLSEGAIEAKVIAMEAIQSKLSLQNRLLMQRLVHRPFSVLHFIQC